MKEAQEKQHAELAKSKEKQLELERLLRSADKADTERGVVRETMGEVLAKKPKLLEALVKPTFRLPPHHQEKKKKLMSNGSTITAPPTYIPAIKLLKAEEGKSWEDFWTKMEKPSYGVLFQHKKTALLHFKQPEGDGEPMLRKWPMEAFKQHLATAEQATVDGEALWPLLLSRRVNEYTASMVEGKYVHLEQVTDEGIEPEGETSVENALSLTVYSMLTWLFNLDFLKSRKIKFRVNPGPLDRKNKPKYRVQRKIDQAMQLIRTVGEEDEKMTRTILFIINETKVDWKFPCTLDECEPPEDEEKRRNLVDFYLHTKTGHKVTRRNALVQIRMYLAYYHRRFGILTTLNTWTFVRLDPDGVMWVSDMYPADQLVDGEEWSVTEMLLRFIVAGLGPSTANDRPFDTMDMRPDFVKEFLLDRSITDLDATFDPFRTANDGEGDDDDDDDEDDDDEEEEEDEVEGDEEPAGSSSSAAGQRRTSGRPSTSPFASASRGKPSATTPQNTIGLCCWADLEDARRNVLGSSGGLTWQESLSMLGELEGDAQPIGSGRTGHVYRKVLGGKDVAIKIVMFGVDRDKDEPMESELLVELDREEQAYGALSDLQGNVIPRFFGQCRLQLGQCLVTEFVGLTAFAALESITRGQMKSALEGLAAIHARNVLHGDVENLNNVLWDNDKQKAVWIDFGCSCVRSTESMEQWTLFTKDETQTCEAKLEKKLAQPSRSKKRNQRDASIPGGC